MVTSIIGKILVNAYNEKYDSNYSIEDFFLKIFYPLFFDHPKYMMTAGNSPFENPKIKWDDMLKGKIPYETKEQRKIRLDKFLNKIREIGADASTAIGYFSTDSMATTSGQVTDMAIEIDRDSIFSSWIGHGLGLGVKGGINILFNDKRILLDIFEGWKYYRDSLNKTKILKGNQINTWNTQWLYHKYSRLYQKTNEMAGFNPYSNIENMMVLDSITWTKLLINISRKYNDVQMMAYLYNIGQTNTTYGFIPFLLNEIRRPIDLYNKLFRFIGNNNNSIEDLYAIEDLYGTAFGLSESCKFGVIGLKALEPKGVKDYIYPKTDQSINKKTINDYKKNEIKYQTYLTWILAMLNNEELWDKSREYATVLHKFVSENDKKISTKRGNIVDKILMSSNKKNLISGLTEILKESGKIEGIDDFAREVNLMTMDNVPYFITLIRFHFYSMNE